MKRLFISIPVLILTFITAFFVYGKVDRYFKYRPVKNADVLRDQIISSINNPFPQADTIILDTRWMFCGNSDPDELPIVFDTHLEEDSYKQMLSARLRTPVLTMTEFNKVMDTVRQIRFNSKYPPSLWDTCRIGKVAAYIKAEQLSSKEVRLYEDYFFDDKSISVRKNFAFEGDRWEFKTTDTSTQLLTK